jgi:hypothetical protein
MSIELDITDFFNNAAPQDYSASIMELGANAATDTWRAACDDSEDYMLLDTDEKREEFREYVKGFGAWEESEIAAWSNTELNALLIQYIAGDIRESGLTRESTLADWGCYARDSEAGRTSGRMFRADSCGPTSGRIYFYIGD